MFYHAHISWLRATLHGAIVVYPKTGVPYPFPNPYDEHVIILGTVFLFYLGTSLI
jgi:laccase